MLNDKKRRLLATLAVTGLLSACAPEVPPLQLTEKSVWLEQNWTPEQRQWFHYASQGTATLPLPYEWLVALEQPEIKVFGNPRLFTANDYLLRFGFIAGKAEPGSNPDGLPVGFAQDKEYRDPVNGQSFHAIGFTCAACHTGHMNYRGTEIRVDGAPAINDITTMVEALGMSMLYTKYVPFRFDRFARRVLGADYNDANKEKLKTGFNAAWDKLQKVVNLQKGVEKQSVKEGFARLDALSRIGNQVFSINMNFNVKNYHPTNAPVNFPHIWHSSWYDWVQYDGSIMQPMIRNAGESLGVAAAVNLIGPKETRFASTTKVQEIADMEQLLAGQPEPSANHKFNGLQSPRWPEQILGRIDAAKAAQGKELYDSHCKGCHLPAPDSDEFWSDKHWKQIDQAVDQRYLVLHNSPIDKIGTDPMQAKALAGRTIDTTGIGLNTTVYAGDNCVEAKVTDGTAVAYGLALGAVVQETIDYWYNKNSIPAEKREEMNGNRPNCLLPAVQYSARPLTGIWATAPYLHNGSVPDLYALLSPVSERPKTIYLGNQEFDPVRVGYRFEKFQGAFELDTGLPGNSNGGHEYSDDKGKTGVIGPRLTPEQRSALIEYLKTL